MTEKKGLLFDQGDLESPFNALLQKCFDRLTPEEQISEVKEALEKAARDGYKKEAPRLLKVLESLYDYGLFNYGLFAFRKMLREEAYGWIETYSFLGGDVPSDLSAGGEFKIDILRKILKGWRPASLVPDSETEENFLFFCQAYKDLSSDEDMYTQIIRKKMENLFRDRLDQIKKEGWPVEFLDSWILREETPEGIVELLLHAQIRIGGVSAAREKIRSLQSGS